MPKITMRLDERLTDLRERWRSADDNAKAWKSAADEIKNEMAMYLDEAGADAAIDEQGNNAVLVSRFVRESIALKALQQKSPEWYAALDANNMINRTPVVSVTVR